MKFIYILLCAAFISCSNDDQIDDNRNIICSGTVSTVKNGASQNMDVCMGVDINNVDIANRYRISLKRTIDSDNSEVLFFNKVKPIFTRQELRFNKFIPDRDVAVASYITSFQQDITNDIYDVDTTRTDNFLIIDSFDEERNEISGRFNVTLNLTSDGNVGSTPPDQIVFENGTFTTEVNPAWFE